MQSIELSGLKELDGRLERVLKEIPDAKRRMHERISKALLHEVLGQIDTSGIRDTHGKIKSWQGANVGSGGGYAAVRAIPGKGPKGYNDSPGAITNYLENGHRVRLPSGFAKKARRGRAKSFYVKGYHFYRAASARSEAIAISEANRFADELSGMIGG